jgi:hypothetical protein
MLGGQRVGPPSQAHALLISPSGLDGIAAPSMSSLGSNARGTASSPWKTAQVTHCHQPVLAQMLVATASVETYRCDGSNPRR